MPEHQLLVVRNARSTRLQRWADGLRSIFLGPFNPKDPVLARLFGSGGPTLSGVSVNEDTATHYSAVYSAVSMISDDIASLPLNLYKRLPNGGKDKFEEHRLYALLHDSPNPEMGTMVWRQVMGRNLLLWQNAYSEIERDQSGKPLALWPLVPERVNVERERGIIRYRVHNMGGGDVFVPPENMIHLKGFSYDGTEGSSLVQRAKESLALGLAAEKFGAAFFGNGGNIGGIVSYKTARPPEMSDKNYREQFEGRYQGVERAHRLLALYNDATYHRTAIPPNEGQFNETRVHQIREVARWFKMPPHMLGDLADATYSNVEQMMAVYFGQCLRPWLALWEEELGRKLISRLERTQQFIEHDTHGFLSVDAVGRSKLYTAEFNTGALTINEQRGYENRDPLPDGDRSFVPLNMMPLDKVSDYWDAQIKSMNAKAQQKQPPPPAPPTRDQLESVIGALRAELSSHDAAVQAEADKRAAVEGARAAAERDAELSRAESVTLKAEREDLAAKLRAKEAADAVTKAQHDAELADQITKRAVLQTQLDAAEALLTEMRDAAKEYPAIRESVGRLEAEKITAIAAQSQATEQAQQEAAKRAALEVRFEALTDAVRGVLVDKVQGILQREIDRARKAQTTPEKLAKWIETFYPLHEDFCRTALIPAVKAWAACQGLADTDAALERWIARHIDESQQQLRGVTLEPDPDAYAAALERVLHRWETERADRTVARWTQEPAA